MDNICKTWTFHNTFIELAYAHTVVFESILTVKISAYVQKYVPLQISAHILSKAQKNAWYICRWIP